MYIWFAFHRRQALFRSCLPALPSLVNSARTSSPSEAGESSTEAAHARWSALLLSEAGVEVAQSGDNSSGALRHGDFPPARMCSRFEMDSCLGDSRALEPDDNQKSIGIHYFPGRFETVSILVVVIGFGFGYILHSADLILAASAQELRTESHHCLAYSSALIERPPQWAVEMQKRESVERWSRQRTNEKCSWNSRFGAAVRAAEVVESYPGCNRPAPAPTADVDQG